MRSTPWLPQHSQGDSNVTGGAAVPQRKAIAATVKRGAIHGAAFITLSLPSEKQVSDNPCLKMEKSLSSRYPTKEIEDVLHVLIRSRRIRDALRKQYGDHAAAWIAELRDEYQRKEIDRDELQDHISEVLLDVMPVVERYKQEGFYGEYSVDICGVKGAYYIRADEGLEIGWFTTLGNARGDLPNYLRAK